MSDLDFIAVNVMTRSVWVLQIHFAKVKSQTDVNKFEMQNT